MSGWLLLLACWLGPSFVAAQVSEEPPRDQRDGATAEPPDEVTAAGDAGHSAGGPVEVAVDSVATPNRGEGPESPARSAAAVPAVAVPAVPATVAVHAEVDGPNAGWHLHMRRSESAPWRDACELPCDLYPETGDWYFGVSTATGGEPTGALPSPLPLTRGGRLLFDYNDRIARHATGGVMIAVGLSGALASTVSLVVFQHEPWGIGYLFSIPLAVSLGLTGFGIGIAVAPNYVQMRWAL